jgi:hypothetical protein
MRTRIFRFRTMVEDIYWSWTAITEPVVGEKGNMQINDYGV